MNDEDTSNLIEPAELDRMYQEGEECDKNDFAEMRSSLLMIAGEHYNRKNSRQWDRIKTTRDLSNEVKIRLTKNHIGKICKRYSNILVTSAPGAAVKPKHAREIQDQKAAELNQSVWVDGKERNDWRNMIVEWADDFVGIGEVWTKIFYDQYAGPVVGYEFMKDELGQPLVDEMGQQIPDQTKPVYQGQLKFEEVYGFNVLRDANAKNIKKSKWYCVRKMVDITDLKKMFPKHADKIQKSEDDTYMVFDGSGYRQSRKGECLVREFFFKPSAKYPKGYYVIHLKGDAILDQGELPEGIFPLMCGRFEYVQTKTRGVAATKQLRPYQLEINRSASKIAEHQITLGDDKIVMSNGSKLSAGAQLPGIRGLTVTGAEPTILPGRNGAQYIDYMMQQIKEMYSVAEIDEDETDTANLEPHTLLYRAASQKRKFNRYIRGFESFIMDVCKTYLAMAKYYLTEDAVISAIGRNEMVNIAEFKSTKDQSIQIVIEPQADDVESRLGRQFTMEHLLQYAGSQLDPSDIGKLIKQMPYANFEDSFSDLTIDYDMSVNDILALDRGEQPAIQQSDKHEYLVRRATARMKQPDFQFMHEMIKVNYQKYIDLHLMMLDQQKQEVARANAGMIPMGGALVGVDYFIQDPNNPDRTRRARFPYDAIDWLSKKLQDQGYLNNIAEQLPPDALARMGQMQVEQASTPGGVGQVPEAQGQSGEIVAPPQA